MPTPIGEHLVFQPVLQTPTVKSVWAKTPPIGATFLPGTWRDAASLEIPEGFLLIKNDQEFLYLLLDLIKDTGNSPGVGDYFWFSFDVDNNAAITPQRDVNYGIYPDLPIRIGRQFYLGPGTWTGILQQPTRSFVRQLFGQSVHTPANHRMWELRIDLKEVGIHLAQVTLPPLLRFGLRVASTTPPFTSDFPVGFFTDFRHLPGIMLALTPTLPSIGKPVVGVGVVPVGTGAPGADGINPATGRASTASTYYLPLRNAAFGGVLNLIGDGDVLQNLWNHNARRYCVKFKGSQQPLLASWTNYHLKNNQWVYEFITPDGDGFYAMGQPSETYSIDNLLFQWNTNGLAAGTYDLEIDFINVSGNLSSTQTIRLMIDNNLPDVEILQIQYKNQTVHACDVVTIDESADPVKVEYRAFDVEGDLYAYGLNAYHGEALVNVLVSTTYPADSHGVADGWVSASSNPKFPPQTCAYEFRLWATPNVVNGYAYIGYTEATSHVTFLCPNAPKYKVMATRAIFPFGHRPINERTAVPR